MGTQLGLRERLVPGTARACVAAKEKEENPVWMERSQIILPSGAFLDHFSLIISSQLEAQEMVVSGLDTPAKVSKTVNLWKCSPEWLEVDSWYPGTGSAVGACAPGWLA